MDEEKLMKIYWKLWTSADFESDFQSDWLAVYQEMQAGNHYNLPAVVVEMCFQYLQEWEKEGKQKKRKNLKKPLDKIKATVL